MTVPATTIRLTTPTSKMTDDKPAIVALDSGFLVAFSRIEQGGTTFTSAIVAQRYDAAGNAVGKAITLAKAAPGLETPSGAPDIVYLGGNKAAIVYQVATSVVGAIIDTKTGAILKQATLADNQLDTDHEITVLSGGKFALSSHTSSSDFAAFKIKLSDNVTVFDSSLQKLGSSAGAYTYSASLTSPPFTAAANEAMIGNGSGGVFFYQDYATHQFFGRSYGATGKLGTKFALNTTKVAETSAFDAASVRIEAAELAKGGYVVTWSSRENHDNALDFDVRARVYTEGGKAIGKDFLVNVDRAGGQLQPDVIALKTGGFAVAWSSGGILGSPQMDHLIRYFDAKGNAVSGEIVTQHFDFLTSPTDGGVMFGNATYAGLSDGSIAKAYPNIFPGNPIRGDGIARASIGTDKADKLNGGAGDDILIAGAGNDVAKGSKGNDILDGFKGDDQLSGDSGNDRLFGGDGKDRLSGGDGADTLEGGANGDTLSGGIGNDVFVFDKASGADTITDFNTKGDRIDLTAFAFRDIDAVLAHATKAGKDVVLDLDGGVHITLQNTTLGGLGATDFLI